MEETQFVTFLPIRKEVAVWKKTQLVTFLPIRKEVPDWKKTQFPTFLPIRKEVIFVVDAFLILLFVALAFYKYFEDLVAGRIP